MVDVESLVPGGGDQNVVLRGVDDGFDGLLVGGEDGLFTSGKVDSVRCLVQTCLAAASDANYLLTSLSSPPLYATLSSSPKQTSSTGARCSNLRMS